MHVTNELNSKAFDFKRNLFIRFDDSMFGFLLFMFLRFVMGLSYVVNDTLNALRI